MMEQKKNYDKLIKALQIASIVFIAIMIIVGLILVKKYNISVKNAETIKTWLNGSIYLVAAILIGFSFVKAFALVITPSIVYLISGMVFESVWVALLVNFIATVVSMIVPYYLGRFTGKGMYDSLKARFPKVQKFDSFNSKNSFVNTLVIKMTGVIPGDLSSLLIGAVGIDFKTFFIAGNIGIIPINILWVCIGHFAPQLITKAVS